MLYFIRNRSRIALCSARQVVGLVIGGERVHTLQVPQFSTAA